jgi:hypothetical protein
MEKKMSKKKVSLLIILGFLIGMGTGLIFKTSNLTFFTKILIDVGVDNSLVFIVWFTIMLVLNMFILVHFPIQFIKRCMLSFLFACISAYFLTIILQQQIDLIVIALAWVTFLLMLLVVGIVGIFISKILN